MPSADHTPHQSQPEKSPYQAPLRPHVYDGIQEFDNRLPNWWLWTFYLAAIFSVVYWFVWYDARAMVSDGEVVSAKISRIEDARLAAMRNLSDDTLWQMSQNPNFVASGQQVFAASCVPCHGANLEGGIGLNLVDDAWKWGNTPMSVHAVVSRGSPDTTKGMKAWLGELSPQQVNQVVAYVLSHHTPTRMAAAPTENPPPPNSL